MNLFVHFSPWIQTGIKGYTFYWQHADVRRMPVYKPINIKYREMRPTQVMVTGCGYVM